jgi:alpha/beta hydrolase family protein
MSTEDNMMSRNTSETETVFRPVPITPETNAPFGGAGSPVGVSEPSVQSLLSAHAYVEEEFFVSGTVHGQPYTTSVLIRRPANVANYSGLTVVEPVHLQGALGLWQTCYPAILTAGHAWATIASQRGAVEGPLKLTNPVRYSELDIPATQESEDTAALLEQWSQGDSATVPRDMFQNNPTANEIMAQVGTLLRAGAPDGPLAGFATKFVLMGGASQTGGQTLNFITAAHKDARLPDGKPVFDGFLPMATTGWQPVSGGDAPVVQIFGEGDLVLFDAIGTHGSTVARPDSDAADDRFRCYQVTAASHLPTRGLRNATGIPLLGLSLQPGERLTQFPWAPFGRAAFVHLVDWVMKGIVPPRAEPVEIEHGSIVRDEWGNARGGVRSPYVDVPTARYAPAHYVRNLIGIDAPFQADRLKEIYGTRDEYLARFDAATDRAVTEGWLLAEDAQQLKQEEAATARL